MYLYFARAGSPPSVTPRPEDEEVLPEAGEEAGTAEGARARVGQLHLDAVDLQGLEGLQPQVPSRLHDGAAITVSGQHTGEVVDASACVPVGQLPQDGSILVGDAGSATLFPYVNPYIIRPLHLPCRWGWRSRRHTPIRAPRAHFDSRLGYTPIHRQGLEGQ